MKTVLTVAVTIVAMIALSPARRWPSWPGRPAWACRVSVWHRRPSGARPGGVLCSTPFLTR